jgi:hypothetical protein
VKRIIVACSSVVVTLMLIPVAPTHSQSLPDKARPQASMPHAGMSVRDPTIIKLRNDLISPDLTYAFMQVLDPLTARIRNILGTASDGTQKFYREDVEVKYGNFYPIWGTLRPEGTNQRAYVIKKVANGTITIGDASNADWNNIPSPGPQPAFLMAPKATISPGLNIKGIYLVRDDEFLYVMMTLYGYPLDYVQHGNYFFQARNLPEDDSFSFYTTAQPPVFPGFEWTTMQISVHFRSKLTEPAPALPPLTSLLSVHPYTTGGLSSLYGDGNGEGFVEWKVPLAEFPIDVIDGKYVDAWTATPPSPPGRIDTTPSHEGVRIVVER